MYAKAHLQVGQLPKCLAADVALVLDFAILLLQRIWECPVAHRTHTTLHCAQVDGFLIRGVLAGITKKG